MKLPPYATRELIAERLPLIFPEGTSQRNYVVREMAASTVFAMLYIGAVEGNDEYAGPIHVYRMTKEQAALVSDDDRLACLAYSKTRRFQPKGERWYADNSRESIRDETLREGLVNLGAVLELKGIATTSSRPRYYLQAEFAQLFDPSLTEDTLDEAIARWRSKYLSPNAIARLRLARHTADQSADVFIQLFSGETRKISPGPSSVISKHVIEQFASRFLLKPALLWLSVSDNKVHDEQLAKAIGLEIQVDKDLPDIILVDLGPKDPIIIFVEVVATDGPISARRQEALYQLTDTARFLRTQIVFVTAYSDRQSSGYSKTNRELAWNSFVWFASEPDRLVFWSNGDRKLAYYLEPPKV